MSLRRIGLFLIDSTILIISYLATYAIAGASSLTRSDVDCKAYVLNFITFFICIFGIRFCMKIYSCVWRYANSRAYILLVASDVFGALVAFIVTRFFLFDVCYLSFWLVFSVVTAFTLISLVSRFCYQYLMNYFNGYRLSKHKINIAIIGAGKSGSLLVDELLHNDNSHYRPLCFIDSDKAKIGGNISGIKIMAESQNIIEQLSNMGIQEIFIALPRLSPEEIKEIYDFYSKSGCKIKVCDFMVSENSKIASRPQLRELKIEDLLFRDSLKINNDSTRDFYKDKVVLVTGGGGSIGSEICRQLVTSNPKKIVIFDIYENNVYDLQQDLKQKYGESLDLSVEIGSVRDMDRLEQLFAHYHPDIVFHAAAHKHVPLMEDCCAEAIKNNVFGTYNTANAAEKYGVKKFIMISTDKAVNPTNVMGATKRICEMIIQSRFEGGNTEFAAVRFGNVLGSNGSVIPLFRRQIQNGGPITITDKRIIRYFMTIPEASQLVLQAGAMAKKGELFVLDMGNPVKIIDLATNMIKLAGFTPYKDIDIVETGLRPGEKLYEELLIKSEELTKTDNDLIFVETDKPVTRDQIDDKLSKLKAVLDDDNNSIRKVIADIVPTYRSPSVVNSTAEASAEMKMVNA